jgi:cyclic nucleotide gated channel
MQSAWRRYFKRKLENSLREAEDRQQYALANEAGTSQTAPSRRFGADALRASRQNAAPNPRVAQRLLPLLSQKPAEPNFAAEDD